MLVRGVLEYEVLFFSSVTQDGGAMVRARPPGGETAATLRPSSGLLPSLTHILLYNEQNKS